MEQNPKSKLSLGLALIALGALLLFSRPKDYLNKADSTFENEPVKVEGFGAAKENEGAIPTRIIIPDLAIDLTVKKAKIVRGFWEVFPDSAAWGEGSGLPGKKGNQVIFAHAKEGLFLPLRYVKTGMKIYVLTNQDWFNYEVRDIKEVFPSATEVIAPTQDEVLTLYTCSGFRDSKRLIVIAGASWSSQVAPTKL